MADEKEVWTKCTPCDYAWRIAFLPMDIRALADVMTGARCPKCGGAALFLATAVDIEKSQNDALTKVMREALATLYDATAKRRRRKKRRKR
jgi:hypothetical protein